MDFFLTTGFQIHFPLFFAFFFSFHSTILSLLKYCNTNHNDWITTRLDTMEGKTIVEHYITNVGPPLGYT